MTTVNLDQILEQVEPEVHLAPSSLILQKIRDVTRDFCGFARAWQWDAPLLSIVANQKTYQIVTPGDAEPVTILYMSKDGATVTPKDPTWLDSFVNGWRTASSDDYRFFTQESRTTFRFAGIPITAKADCVFYRLALKPGPTSDELDEDVWSDWYHVLGAGVKGQLMLMSGKPWTDLKTGSVHANVYRIGRANARIRYSKGYTDSEQRAHGAFFA